MKRGEKFTVKVKGKRLEGAGHGNLLKDLDGIAARTDRANRVISVLLRFVQTPTAAANPKYAYRRS
jgi:hypothetical protein